MLLSRTEAAGSELLLGLIKTQDVLLVGMLVL